MTVEDIRRIASPACDHYGVKRLDLFGSLARGDNSPASDVDLLVEFENPDLHPSKRFFGLLHYLEDTLRCGVDLLTINGLRNPYFRRRVTEEKVNIYAK
jgi:uncharacterized protein